MKYERLLLQDIEQIRPFLGMMKCRTCDFTVGGMFMWRDFYKVEYAVENSTFFSRIRDMDGNIYYNLPAAEHIESAVNRLITDEEHPIRFCFVPEEYLPLFSCYNSKISEEADWFDYIYRAEDLKGLKGNQYRSKRNNINTFKRNHPNWSFELIDSLSMNKVIDFFRDTYLPMSGNRMSEQEENANAAEVLDNFDAYGMVGGYLTADGKIFGFSVNEIIGDTMFTHIEKADRRCVGAYQMVVNQTALAFADNDVLFINAEEDTGDPGLRQSKLLYHPVKMLKKYTVEIK